MGVGGLKTQKGLRIKNRSDTKTAGRILDIHYDIVHQMTIDDLGQKVPECPSAWLANHIADEEQLHLAYSMYRFSRITVTLIWPG